jgi:hypothetical protein
MTRKRHNGRNSGLRITPDFPTMPMREQPAKMSPVAVQESTNNIIKMLTEQRRVAAGFTKRGGPLCPECGLELIRARIYAQITFELPDGNVAFYNHNYHIYTCDCLPFQTDEEMAAKIREHRIKLETEGDAKLVFTIQNPGNNNLLPMTAISGGCSIIAPEVGLNKRHLNG